MGKGPRKVIVLFLALLAAVWATARDGATGLAEPPEPVELAVPGIVAAPLPSPDGRFLAFTGPSFEGLWLLDLQAGNTFRLTDQKGAGFRPAWSPDGHTLCYEEGGRDLHGGPGQPGDPGPVRHRRLGAVGEGVRE